MCTRTHVYMQPPDHALHGERRGLCFAHHCVPIAATVSGTQKMLAEHLPADDGEQVGEQVDGFTPVDIYSCTSVGVHQCAPMA